MYDLYFHKSPNTIKVALFLEETDLPYEPVFVNVSKGEQFDPDFMEISPNCKVPVLIDHDAAGGEKITIFESGAILLYLAEKTGKLLPTDLRGRWEVMQWLFWHTSSQSPMNGQLAHFRTISPETTYAVDRYTREVRRLLDVMNTRLSKSAFLGGPDYSIADIASFPWLDKFRTVLGLETLNEFPHIKTWGDKIAARDAVARAYAKLQHPKTVETDLVEMSMNMFGMTRDEAEHAANNARANMSKIGFKLA